MTYSKQIWTPNVTPVDAAHMQHIEDGIAAVEAEALPQPIVNGQWLKGSGGAAVWSPITPSDIVDGALNLVLPGSLILPGIIRIYKAMSEANEQIRLAADGAGAGLPALIFGPGGGGGLDAYFYRSGTVALAVNVGLSVGGPLNVTGGISATAGISTTQAGAGGVAFQAGSLDPSGYLLVMKQAADAGWRILWTPEGMIHWGDGTGALDTVLYRSAAGILKTDGSFYAGSSLALDTANTGSKFYFGTLNDAYLFRKSANVIRTDQTLDANALSINGKAVKVTGCYIDSTGVVTGNRGITCTHTPGSGLYQITFPAMSYPVVTVTPTSTLTMAAAQLVSATTVNIFTTSGAAPVDAGINVIIMDANG